MVSSSVAAAMPARMSLSVFMVDVLSGPAGAVAFAAADAFAAGTGRGLASGGTGLVDVHDAVDGRDLHEHVVVGAQPAEVRHRLAPCGFERLVDFEQGPAGRG